MSILHPIAPEPSVQSTQTSGVYDRIRFDILEGHLEPGVKLGMRLLTTRYATGQTPIREALNRLATEHLVDVRDQRGFSVATISQEEQSELTRTRCAVEALALRQSMAAATPDWEEQLVLAHHRLSRTPRSLQPDRFDDNPEWERLHRAFHRALIGNCGSKSLIEFCRQLADLLYRYRRISIRKAFGQRNVDAEHKAILDAVLAGDADRASALLEQHYVRTAAFVTDGTVA